MVQSSCEFQTACLEETVLRNSKTTQNWYWNYNAKRSTRYLRDLFLDSGEDRGRRKRTKVTVSLKAVAKITPEQRVWIDKSLIPAISDSKGYYLGIYSISRNHKAHDLVRVCYAFTTTLVHQFFIHLTSVFVMPIWEACREFQSDKLVLTWFCVVYLLVNRYTTLKGAKTKVQHLHIYVFTAFIAFFYQIWAKQQSVSAAALLASTS